MVHTTRSSIESIHFKTVKMELPASINQKILHFNYCIRLSVIYANKPIFELEQGNRLVRESFMNSMTIGDYLAVYQIFYFSVIALKIK